MKSTRFFGIGNADRGDDGAGLLAAQRLHDHGKAAVAFQGELFSLIHEWTGVSHVVLIDAMQSGAPPGTLKEFDAAHLPEDLGGFRGSTHGFSVLDVIRVANSLGRLPPQLTLVAIEGEQFEAGSELSEPVIEAVDQVVERWMAVS